METPTGPLLLAALLFTAMLAGCAGPRDADATALAPLWRVGDSWTYLRTGPTGAESVHVRTVTSLHLHGAHMVYEVRSGIRNHVMQDYHLYTTDDLRFVGSDLREGSLLVKRLTVEDPFVFHYIFPLVPGTRMETEGSLKQVLGPHQQTDPVRVVAVVEEPTELVLGERVYDVIPYEIRIEYLVTPFDDAAVLRGHWSPAVGQSVLTEITEGGATMRQELLFFERMEPERGEPAYRLVPPLSSRRLERGFQAELDDAGWKRFLFHVTDPIRVRVDVRLPDEDVPDEVSRLDLVSLRPVGYTHAGIADRLDQIASAGLLLHVAASHGGGETVVRHAAQGLANNEVQLSPGQVYELILASNLGRVSMSLEHTGESQDFPAQQGGRVGVLSVQHNRVQEITLPGPQRVEDAVSADLRVPRGERIEGIVYAINHGGTGALGELGAERKVRLNLNGWPFEDEDSLYAYYFGFAPPEGFQAQAAFEYRADLAVRGVADYEVGLLLMRLL